MTKDPNQSPEFPSAAGIEPATLSAWLLDHLQKFKSRRKKRTCADAEYLHLLGISVDKAGVYQPKPKQKKDKCGRDPDDSRTLDIEALLAMGGEKANVG